MSEHSALMERFWDKVMPEPNSGCWLWIGAIASNGYGQISVNRKLVVAHRFSYAALIGPIHDWPISVVDHLCKNKLCVNPAHLENTTQRINNLRSNSITARHARKTHCPQGHPYSGDNLYVYPNGARKCRTCKRARDRRYDRERRIAARAFLAGKENPDDRT